MLGMGFVLTPDEAGALIERNPKNRDCLFPYLNGEDLNSRPDQSPSRWVINFHDWPLDRSAEGQWFEADDTQHKEWLRSGLVPADYPDLVAADYPELLAIVEKRVKPERDLLKNGDATAKDRARRWWQFGRPTIKLYATIEGMARVLARTQVSRLHMFEFVRTDYVLDQRLACTALHTFSDFSVLQSSVHEDWGLNYGSTLRADATYTPSSCFETFPFPENIENLHTIGEQYHEQRNTTMQARQEGLTKTYNRFHDPNESAAEIIELRSLHVKMDQAVAASYGWDNLDLGHGFHVTKQGIHFTISEAARREVLDRLLALNQQRYAEEVAAGLHDTQARSTRRSTPPPRHQSTASDGATPQRDLFDAPQPGLFDKPAVTQDAVPTIHAYLRQHPGWHGKDAIINGSGCPSERWNVAIKTLLDSGHIERQGERRGARYRLRVPE